MIGEKIVFSVMDGTVPMGPTLVIMTTLSTLMTASFILIVMTVIPMASVCTGVMIWLPGFATTPFYNIAIQCIVEKL